MIYKPPGWEARKIYVDTRLSGTGCPQEKNCAVEAAACVSSPCKATRTARSGLNCLDTELQRFSPVNSSVSCVRWTAERHARLRKPRGGVLLAFDVHRLSLYAVCSKGCMGQDSLEAIRLHPRTLVLSVILGPS